MTAKHLNSLDHNLIENFDQIKIDSLLSSTNMVYVIRIKSLEEAFREQIDGRSAGFLA